MTYRITLMIGDGVGPEISEATLAVIDAAGLNIDWHEVPVGQRGIDEADMPHRRSSNRWRKPNVPLKDPSPHPLEPALPVPTLRCVNS